MPIVTQLVSGAAEIENQGFRVQALFSSESHPLSP